MKQSHFKQIYLLTLSIQMGIFLVRFLFMKISRNFERSLTPYILSLFKMYKHLFYKHESVFMNFYRFFESL